MRSTCKAHVQKSWVRRASEIGVYANKCFLIRHRNINVYDMGSNGGTAYKMS